MSLNNSPNDPDSHPTDASVGHDVTDDLNGADPPPEPTDDPAEIVYESLTLADLIDHIVAVHHTFARTELERLDGLSQRVASVHGGEHSELFEVRSLVRSLRDELEHHMMKEERILFPAIRELDLGTNQDGFAFGSISNPIRVMLRDHEDAENILAALEEVTHDYLAPVDSVDCRELYDGIRGVMVDTVLHVHIENDVLFPGAIERENLQR